MDGPTVVQCLRPMPTLIRACLWLSQFCASCGIKRYYSPMSWTIHWFQCKLLTFRVKWKHVLLQNASSTTSYCWLLSHKKTGCSNWIRRITAT